MLAIQVFAPDKKNVLFWIPMPRLLSEYQELLDEAVSFIEENKDELAEDIDRDAEIISAGLIGNVERWKRDPEKLPQSVDRDINAAILSYVFASPAIRQNFRLRACAYFIQVAVPATPGDDPAVQWCKWTEETREGFMEHFIDDEETRRKYIAQADENIEWLESGGIEAMLGGKIQN